MNSKVVSPQSAWGSGSVQSARPQFQHTDLGFMPADWNIRALEEIGNCLIGLTYDPKNIDSDGVLVLRSSNISGNSLQFEDNIYVEMRIPDRIIVREDDLLICVRNGSRALIGKCALVQGPAVGMTFGAFMSVFRSTDSRFVFYCFQSDIITRQIHEHLGATINQITNKSLNSFKIPYPQTEERETIAEALSDVDDLLGELDALIAKKRAVKQASMQQLLTGKTHLPGFSGEWETKRLGELRAFAKGRGVKREDISTEGVPCVLYGELYTRYHNYTLQISSRISPQVAQGALPIKAGDILFAGSGETAEDIGCCASYLGNEKAYAGGDIIVLRPTGQDPIYLGHLLNHPTVQAQKARMGQGNAVVHISTRNLAQVQINLPPFEEQAAIGTVLFDMDAEIAVLERRRDKARAIKSGMMQELLTGRVRLVKAGG